MIDKKKITTETLWSFASKGIVFVFFIAINAFLARCFGVDKFGEWSFFYSVMTIVLLFSTAGIDKSSRKFVAQYHGSKYLGDVLQSSIQLRIAFSLGFTLIFLLLFNPLADLIDKPFLKPLFLAAIPFIMLSGVVEYMKNIFQGLHQLKYNFLISVSEFGLKFIVVLTLLLFSNGMITVVYAYNIALLAASLVGLYVLYVRFPEFRKPKEKDFKKEIFRYSIPLFFTTVGIMVITEIDTVMLGLLSSNSEVGIYSVAKQAIVKLPHIAFAISLGTMPVFARITHENKDYLRNMFVKLLKSNAIIFGIIAIIIFSTGWFFIPLIFGEEYSAAILPMHILTFYMIGHSFSFFLNAFLDYQGLARKRAVNITLSIALNIFLNYILIPKYGAAGAALATVISYLPYLLLNWFEVKKVLA